MSNVLRLAIVDPNDSTREALKTSLLGLETVWLEAECSRYAFFKDVLEQTNPDVGFIAMDGDPDRAVELVEEVTQAKPGVALLVSSSSTDGNLILRTMRAGAKEFLPHPIKPEDLAAALQRIAQDPLWVRRDPEPGLPGGRREWRDRRRRRHQPGGQPGV